MQINSANIAYSNNSNISLNLNLNNNKSKSSLKTRHSSLSGDDKSPKVY